MNYLHRLLLAVASAAFFIASAQAQNAGTVTNHAFAVGKGAGQAGYTSLLCGSAQLAVGQSAADPICRSLSGDATMDAAGAVTLANSSTTRGNLGLAIGSNVEAWDADLDCVAGLSSTGVLKRTGAGTCSAGTVALSDLSTGTQDTVVGYFGATSASAATLPNCSNSLTYSTSTHSFGCNASAGTGTVTSVGITNTYGHSISGSPVTASGNISLGVSLTSLTNSLAADVSLNNTANYFDGPSVAQGTSGTWFASGSVSVVDTAGIAAVVCKLWDGTTVISSGRVTTGGASQYAVLALSGALASPAGNIKISCRDTTSTSGIMTFNGSVNSKDGTLTAIRIQ